MPDYHDMTGDYYAADLGQAELDDETFTFERRYARPPAKLHSTLYIWRVIGPTGLGFYRYINDPDIPLADDGVTPNPYFVIGEARARDLEDNPVPCSAGSLAAFFGDPGDGLCGAWQMGRSWSGFASITQARRWFRHRDDCTKLANAGFQLVAYRRADLRNVAIGGHQAVFDPPADAPFARLSLRDLYALSAAALCARVWETFQ